MALPRLQDTGAGQAQARDWGRGRTVEATPARDQIEIVGTLGKQLFPRDESVYGEAGYSGYRIYFFKFGRELRKLKTHHRITARLNDKVVATGSWVRYKGEEQFEAVCVDLDMPRDVKGVAKWIEKLPGFGKATIRKLVDHFGEELADALVDVERLVASGIVNRKKAEVAAEIAEGQRPQREMYSYLHGIGIGPVQASRIMEIWGMRTKANIKENAWRLATLVPGIGFKTADEIALRERPSDFESTNRIVAALQAGVKQAVAEDGHTGRTLDEAVEDARRLTGLSPSLIAPHAEAALSKGGFAIDPFTLLASTDRMHEAEAEFARKVISLLQSPAIPRERAEAALAKAEARIVAAARRDGFDLRFHETQRAAALQALTCNISIITGGPGTGKSTILKLILESLKELGRDVVLAAPTGRAAKRMQEAVGNDFPASTCHRLLAFQDNDAKHDHENPFDEDWFVVDEASMLDQVLARDFTRPISECSGLTLIGDVDQLPSVGPGQVLRDLIASGVVPVTRLTHIYRQAEESGIIVAARRINRGDSPVQGEPVRGFHMIESDDVVSTAGTIVRQVLEKIPQLNIKGRFKGPLDLATDVQVLAAQRKGPAGVEALNNLIKQALNPSRDDGRSVTFGSKAHGSKTFTVGDRVMQTKNDYKKKVYNGEVGTIVEVGMRVPKEESPGKARKGMRQSAPRKGEPCFVADFAGHRATYVSADAGEIEPAYATTVHKSQGSQYPVIVLACPMDHAFAFNRNLLYTAVTRASELCIVVGSKAAVNKAAASQTAKLRRTGLVERLRAMAPVLDLRDAEPEMGEAVPAPGM